MSILNQKTLSKAIKVNGIGLHTGKQVNIRILPSEPNTGIIFKRVDIKDRNNIVIPKFYNVVDTNLCTTIRNQNNTEVQTVEHLIAAFYLTGIDNVIVEIDNVEVPIMDGSSK